MRRIALLAAVMVALAACQPAAVTVQHTPAPGQTVLPVDWTPPPQPSASAGSTHPNAGTVFFGARLAPDGLSMPAPQAKVPRTSKKVAWLAHLTEPAGATGLTATLLRGTGGKATELDSWTVETTPEALIVTGTMNPAALTKKKTGPYTLRISREGATLSEGTFSLTR